ncbi:RWD domain-containing protein [Sergentomyia squamirostris]
MDDEIRIQNDLLRNCLREQMVEFEALEAMYCNPGEFLVDDHSISADINDFLEEKSNFLTRKLSYRICLPLDDGKLFLSVELPHLYPSVEIPRICVDSTKLNKKQEIATEVAIEEFIGTIDKSDPYIYQIISWVQENIDELKANEELGKKSHVANNPGTFERLWIYSHHIKNKTKRKDIVKNANDLSLTGFALPGKPGIICVEGEKSNTQEFWSLLRQMHWQKITLKKSEVISDCVNFENVKLFPDFREILFADVGDDEEVVLNMSNFVKFLNLHKCGYMKKELFGFE